MFSHIEDDLIFVSDNGAAITKQGQQLFNSIIDQMTTTNWWPLPWANEATGIPILCALDAPTFQSPWSIDQIYRTFYTNIYYFDDFASVDAVANKFTVYTPNNDAVDQYRTFTVRL